MSDIEQRNKAFEASLREYAVSSKPEQFKIGFDCGFKSGYEAAKQDSEWLKPEIEMPKSGHLVIIAYKNVANKWRIVRGKYLPKHFEPCAAFGDEDEDSVDEVDTELFFKEGWYEENEESEVLYPISEQILGWQPLPLPPAS